jgi:hypothetical protein
MCDRDVEYEKYAKRMVFEHNLINNRLTWLLVSQTLLFSGYATSIEKSITALKVVIPKLGFALSLLAFISIAASFMAKWLLWQEVRQVPGFEHEKFWVSTPITYIAGVAELSVPIAFIAAWACL